MTAYEEIKEKVTIEHLVNLRKNGAFIDLLSKSFGLSINKVKNVINIKNKINTD